MKLIVKISFLALIINLFIFPIIANDSVPKTIIIIRHADKLDIENCGPALSPKGNARSMAFALYYINTLNAKYGYSFPDYIFATNPYKSDSKYYSIKSFRHLMTVSPLATWMYFFREAETSEYMIDIPFNNDEYEQLAEYIYNKSHLNNKTILICWSHTEIPELVDELTKGFKVSCDGFTMPFKWSGDDYSSIIILEYGKKKSIIIKKLDKNETYPVSDNLNEQLSIIYKYYDLFGSSPK